MGGGRGLSFRALRRLSAAGRACSARLRPPFGPGPVPDRPGATGPRRTGKDGLTVAKLTGEYVNDLDRRITEVRA